MGLYVGVFLLHASENDDYFGTNTNLPAARDAAKAYAHKVATLLHNNTNVWSWVSVRYGSADPYDSQIYDYLAQGILDDAGPDFQPIIGIHPGTASTSVTDFSNRSWLSIHMLQSGHQFEHFEDSMGRDWKQTDELIDGGYSFAKPIFDAEPIYENIVDKVWREVDPPPMETDRRANASIVRFKAYEAVFAGAFGHTYAHENSDYLWTMAMITTSLLLETSIGELLPISTARLHHTAGNS